MKLSSIAFTSTVRVVRLLKQVSTENQFDVARNKLGISDHQIGFRRALAGVVQELLQETMNKQARVVLFGSSFTGLGFFDCDIDSTILVPLDASGSNSMLPHNSEQYIGILKSVRSILPREFMVGRKCVEIIGRRVLVPSTRFPLLQLNLTINRSGYRVPLEISVNNNDGIARSKWLNAFQFNRTVGKVTNPVFHNLVLALCFWARSARLFDQTRRLGLKSFVLVQLLISYLQHLNLVAPAQHVIDRKRMTSSDVYKLRPDKWDTELSLVGDFFQFLVDILRRDEGTFSKIIFRPYTGGILNVDQSGIGELFKCSYLNVEDPILPSENCARSLQMPVHNERFIKAVMLADSLRLGADHSKSLLDLINSTQML